MRVLLALVLCSGLGPGGVAQAKRAKPAEAAAPVESAAARATRLAMADDTGARRDSDLRAPVLENAAAGVADAQERGPNDAPTKMVESTARLSGAMEELVARQMQRNGAGLDRCIVELRARDPQLRGELILTMSVAQKRASAIVAGTSAVRGDALFTQCVAESAKGMRFSLPDSVFPWRISLGR